MMNVRTQWVRRWVSILAVALGLSMLVPGSVAAQPPSSVLDGLRFPVVLNGRTYQPHEFSALQDRTLAFAVTDQAVAQGVVYAFDTAAERDHFMGVPYGATSAPTRAAAWGCEVSTFYPHSNYRWNTLNVCVGGGISDLRQVGWNDQISSLKAARGGYHEWTVLYEHSNYGGSSIRFGSGAAISNLSDYGWNDRASSISVFAVGVCCNA